MQTTWVLFSSFVAASRDEASTFIFRASLVNRIPIGLLDNIKVEFVDNGLGIPDEQKEYIFQRDYDNLKGGKGLGFGLSVVKKVIEGYNGKLLVEDKIKGDYSKGTNFIIILPLLPR